MATEITSRVLEGEIVYPYKWATGAAAGAFFTALRDDSRILGARCPKCNKLWVPPYEFCPVCYVDVAGYEPVANAGVVESFTVVRHPMPWKPANPPYVLAAVRLDGADSDLIHLLKADPDSIKIGMRVKVEWAAERGGSLMDIKHFVPA